ncbi:hypothetical protein F183_A41550 [Bryobacterales bacterium F-183]|nr:hypothetical protein F183_A41550 [Bryobacterales bacterium F-183]
MNTVGYSSVHRAGDALYGLATQRLGAMFGVLAVFHQKHLYVLVLRQDTDGFRSAIASVTDNSNVDLHGLAMSD